MEMPDVITTLYDIIKITDLFSGIPVCLRLVNRLLKVSKFEKTHSKFLICRGCQVVVNLLSDRLSNTRELHSLFTTGNPVIKTIDGITSLDVCVALEVVFSLVSTFVDHRRETRVVRDEVILIISLSDERPFIIRGCVSTARLIVTGCDRLRVRADRLLIVRVLLIEVLVNLGSDTLTNTRDMHETLTTFHLVG